MVTQFARIVDKAFAGFDVVGTENVVDSEVEFVLAEWESESVSCPGECVVEFFREQVVGVFVGGLVEVAADDGESFPVF